MKTEQEIKQQLENLEIDLDTLQDEELVLDGKIEALRWVLEE